MATDMDASAQRNRFSRRISLPDIQSKEGIPKESRRRSENGFPKETTGDNSDSNTELYNFEEYFASVRRRTSMRRNSTTSLLSIGIKDRVDTQLNKRAGIINSKEETTTFVPLVDNRRNVTFQKIAAPLRRASYSNDPTADLKNLDITPARGGSVIEGNKPQRRRRSSTPFVGDVQNLVLKKEVDLFCPRSSSISSSVVPQNYEAWKQAKTTLYRLKKHLNEIKTGFSTVQRMQFERRLSEE